MKERGNIFENLPNETLTDEISESLLEAKGFKLERIVSTGQITPEDQWLVQKQDEWVLLLQGQAKLIFTDNKEICLTRGDYIFIPAHQQHRVAWTDPEQVCVWLAFHL